jgi:hypothetical protein
LNHVELQLPVVEQAVNPFVDELVALHAALHHHLLGGREKKGGNKEKSTGRKNKEER